VFLDEFAPDGTKVQSLALPTAANGTHRALVASGTNEMDGLLTRSADGACLVVPGYGRDLGTGSGNLDNHGTTARRRRDPARGRAGEPAGGDRHHHRH
jgi:hypothetical protein